MITQSLLKEMFDYDAETGNLIRKIKTTNAVKIGDVAGSKAANGYIRIVLGDKSHPAHRLVWLYHTGALPVGEIDHINRVKHDNRIENLRDVTRSVNVSNCEAKNAVGLKGVKRHGNKFIARIGAGDGKVAYLGIFPTAEEAHEAFKDAHVTRFGSNSEYFRKAA